MDPLFQQIRKIRPESGDILFLEMDDPHKYLESIGMAKKWFEKRGSDVLFLAHPPGGIKRLLLKNEVSMNRLGWYRKEKG